MHACLTRRPTFPGDLKFGVIPHNLARIQNFVKHSIFTHVIKYNSFSCKAIPIRISCRASSSFSYGNTELRIRVVDWIYLYFVEAGKPVFLCGCMGVS